MNSCALSGHLHRPAVLLAEGKVLKFTLETRYRFRKDPAKEGVTYVPCVLFEPTKEMEQLLMDKEAGKWHYELQGRITRSSYDGTDGERRYNTEVVIDPASIVLRKMG